MTHFIESQIFNRETFLNSKRKWIWKEMRRSCTGQEIDKKSIVQSIQKKAWARAHVYMYVCGRA